MAIMMNGKEIRNLIVSGEVFSKGYVNRRVRILNTGSGMDVRIGHNVNITGYIYYSETDTVHVGDEFVVFAKVQDALFIGNSPKPPSTNSSQKTSGLGMGWIPMSGVQFLD